MPSVPRRRARPICASLVDALEDRLLLSSAGPVRVIDDGDSGFTQAGGGWTASPTRYLSYNGDFSYHRAGTGSGLSQWRFGGVAGGWYEVAVSWDARTNLASNAPFSVFDGSVLESFKRVDQRQAASGLVWQTQTWQSLGQFHITSGNVLVQLTDDADSLVMADAVRLVPLPDVAIDGNSLWSAPPIDFGQIPLGEQGGIRTMHLVNRGDDAVRMRLTSSTAAVNSYSFGTWMTLAGGESRDVTLYAAAPATGRLNGQLMVECWDHLCTPRTITWSGEFIDQTLIDDPSPSFATQGNWQAISHSAAFNSSYQRNSPANTGDFAEWHFGLVPPGTRAVEVRLSNINRTAGGQYQILVDGVARQTIDWASAAAKGGSGASWIMLGTVTTSGRIDVRLSAAAAGDLLAADAVRLRQVPRLTLQLVDVNQLLSAQGTIVFPSISTGGSAVRLRLRNDGSAPLVLGSALAVPAGFRVLTAAGTLQTGAVEGAWSRGTLLPGELMDLVLSADAAGGAFAASPLSFTTNAPGARTVQLQLRGPGAYQQILDQPAAGGWEYRSGSWLQMYQHNFIYARPEWPRTQVQWRFTDLEPGVYDIATTWIAAANLAVDAPYSISVDGVTVSTVRVNQQSAPADDSAQGSRWEKLSSVAVSNGSIVVTLTNFGASGIVQADAVRLTRQTLLGEGDRLLDAGDPGYSEQGVAWFGRSALWMTNFDMDFRFARCDWSLTTANWNFTQVAPGRYEVLSTWMAAANQAPDAPFSVSVGNQLQFSGTVDQRLIPHDLQLNGQGWKSLGILDLTSPQHVRVSYSNRASAGIVVADAIWLRRIAEAPGATSGVILDLPAVPAFRQGEFPTISARSGSSPEFREYRFWLQKPQAGWSLVQDFSSKSSWQWNTLLYTPGEYKLRVESRRAGNRALQDFALAPLSLRESVDQLWNRLVMPILQDDLWYSDYRYDAANDLMIPLITAFQQQRTDWLNQFAGHFQQLVTHGSEDNGVNGRLSWLQYLSLPGQFVAQAALTGQPNLVSGALLDFLYAEVKRFWLEELAWHWTLPTFANMQARLQWKLGVNPDTLERSYYNAIIDEETFVMAIAANLKTYERLTGQIRTDSAVVDDVLALARQMLNQRGTWQQDRWLFQVGTWDDFPDYAYAGNSQLAPNLLPRPLTGTSPDSAHAHRIPELIASLIDAYAANSSDRTYYLGIRSGAEQQFFQQVLLSPTADFAGYRLTNYMDGRNGVYRYGAWPGSDVPAGYGPYELSGRFLYGWWSFLDSDRIRQAYLQMSRLFPLQENVLRTYTGSPPDDRVTHPFTALPGGFENGFLELTTLLAATLDL